MYDELFKDGLIIKHELRLLAKTLRNKTLVIAADYIDKLEVELVTAEGYKLGIENKGIEKPISEILSNFQNKKPKPARGELLNRIEKNEVEKIDLPIEIQHLGDKSINALIILIKESRDWAGEPCVGASAAMPSLRGALPHLKKAGLLTTVSKPDSSQRGKGTYVQFTDLGIQIAKKIEEQLDLLDPM